jgi:hypothetical protein
MKPAARSPPAPGMFCTTMVGLPGTKRPRWRASSRAKVSKPPPVPDATTILIVCPRKNDSADVCAKPSGAASIDTVASPATQIVRAASVLFIRFSSRCAALLLEPT